MIFKRINTLEKDYRGGAELQNTHIDLSVGIKNEQYTILKDNSNHDRIHDFFLEILQHVNRTFVGKS